MNNQKFETRVGKYSYGPLCGHRLVESVGAFTSISMGADVVPNHPMNYISTHPFLFSGCEGDIHQRPYDSYADKNWYFPGVQPHGIIPKTKKIHIGNDVWIGKDVIITNGSDIGNGAVLGAGAIVTTDVPDYAVAAGVPAKIIRYRYAPDQIRALNRICWWDWDDDAIRDAYDDFYGDIDDFIFKYDCNIPFLSIIIPIYNGEKYLEETLDSVYNEKQDKLQIILVNDGSDDATDAICERFIDRAKKEGWDQHKYIKSAHRGVSAARNIGIENSDGKYIAFLDADDIWNSCIEKLMPFISGQSVKYDMIGLNVRWCKDNLELKKEYNYSAFEISEPGYENVINGNRYFGAYIYRKSFLVRNGLDFPEGIDFQEDEMFLTKCLYELKKLKIMDFVNILHRSHLDSWSHNRYPGSGKRHIYEGWKRCKEYFDAKYQDDKDIIAFCENKMNWIRQKDGF